MPGDNGSATIAVTEAAERLGVNRTTVYQAMRLGQIPAIRLGKRVVIPRAAFERMLEYGSPDGGPGETVDVKDVLREIRRESLLLQKEAIEAELRELENKQSVGRER